MLPARNKRYGIVGHDVYHERTCDAFSPRRLVKLQGVWPCRNQPTVLNRDPLVHEVRAMLGNPFSFGFPTTRASGRHNGLLEAGGKAQHLLLLDRGEPADSIEDGFFQTHDSFSPSMIAK
jgi:hypothetical protein